MKQKPLDIDWMEVAKIGMPIVGPFIQAGMWYGFVNIDKRAQALGRLIAIAEVIPTVELNLPKGVVLASMYDYVDDAATLLLGLLEAVRDIPDKVKKEVEEAVNEIVSEVKEDIIPEGIDETKAVGDFQDCIAGFFRDTPSYLQNRLSKGIYITGCMVRKGYTQKYIGELIKRFID